jgi:hypothetical protein
MLKSYSIPTALLLGMGVCGFLLFAPSKNAIEVIPDNYDTIEAIHFFKNLSIKGRLGESGAIYAGSAKSIEVVPYEHAGLVFLDIVDCQARDVSLSLRFDQPTEMQSITGALGGLFEVIMGETFSKQDAPSAKADASVPFPGIFRMEGLSVNAEAPGQDLRVSAGNAEFDVFESRMEFSGQVTIHSLSGEFELKAENAFLNLESASLIVPGKFAKRSGSEWVEAERKEFVLVQGVLQETGEEPDPSSLVYQSPGTAIATLMLSNRKKDDPILNSPYVALLYPQLVSATGSGTPVQDRD